MDVKTKMPSLVEEIKVAVGQNVEKGDILCVVEAMKMKNKMPAPVAGVVKSIECSEGDRLKPGALIMVIE